VSIESLPSPRCGDSVGRRGSRRLLKARAETLTCYSDGFLLDDSTKDPQPGDVDRPTVEVMAPTSATPTILIDSGQLSLLETDPKPPPRRKRSAAVLVEWVGLPGESVTSVLVATLALLAATHWSGP